MESLAQVKQAMDAGLVTAHDYELAKAAFLRAQQIRCGFEAGLLSAEDAEHVKRAFTDSLNTLHVSTPLVELPAVTASAPIPVPTFDVPPTPEPCFVFDGKMVLPPEPELEVVPPPPVAPVAVAAPPVPQPVEAPPVAAPAYAPPAAVASPAYTPPPAAVASPAYTPPPAAPVAEPMFSPAPVASPAGPAPVYAGKRVAAAGPKGGFGRSVSGVLVAEDCVLAYKNLMNKRRHRYLTFKVEEAAGMVVLDEAGAANASYGAFVDALPEGDCRYAVYDYEYTNDDGCIFNKLVFVMWTPDCSPLKHKMLYASTKDFFRQHLQGVGMEMQVTEADEIEKEQMHEKVRETLTRK